MADHDEIMRRLLELERAYRSMKRDIERMTDEEVMRELENHECSTGGEGVVRRDRLLRAKILDENPKGYSVPWYDHDNAVVIDPEVNLAHETTLPASDHETSRCSEEIGVARLEPGSGSDKLLDRRQRAGR